MSKIDGVKYQIKYIIIYGNSKVLYIYLDNMYMALIIFSNIIF